MKRVISVYLPTWPTDRLRLGNPSLTRDKPLVTVEKDGAKRILASVDALARKQKLRVGQTLAYARAVLPHLQTLEADHEADEKTLYTISLSFLKRYSPIVAVTPPQTIWIDITGCAHLYGGEANLIEDLKQQFESKQILAKIALADTAGCAFALAKWNKRQLTIVPTGEQQDRLQSIPLSGLRLPEIILARLARLGIHRIGQLYTMPRAPLVRRYGKELLQRLDQALGKLSEPLEPIETPEIPQIKCAFTEPAANPDYIEKAIKQLTIKLCEQLEARKLGARRLDLLFQRVDNSLQAIRVGTVNATRQPNHCMRLIKEHLDKINYGHGVEALKLSAPLTETLASEQFVSELGSKLETNLSALVDVLQNRLGAAHVYQVASIESDVPERSLKRVSGLVKKKVSVWPSELPRPSRILRRPEKVEAMALLPDHAPRHFIWRRNRHVIKRSNGVERVFGEWWRDNTEVFAVWDYFEVEDEAGQRFWLFRRGDGSDQRTGSHEWFLHGFFG